MRESMVRLQFRLQEGQNFVVYAFAIFLLSIVVIATMSSVASFIDGAFNSITAKLAIG